MSEKILFQKDRLTVSESKITVGDATIFYPSVTATSIYEGRPLIGLAYSGIFGLLGIGFVTLLFGGMLGLGGAFKFVLVMLIPAVGMVIVGLSYKVKCLFLGAGGGSLAILKSRDRSELESAQHAIEAAKRAYEGKERKA